MVAVKKSSGGKKPGDVNLTLREKKYLAQNDHLKAKLDAEKAKVRVKDAQLKEVREKLQTALGAAKAALAKAAPTAPQSAVKAASEAAAKKIKAASK